MSSILRIADMCERPEGYLPGHMQRLIIIYFNIPRSGKVVSGAS